jgi:hypothetical protein
LSKLNLQGRKKEVMIEIKIEWDGPLVIINSFFSSASEIPQRFRIIKEVL